MVTCAWNHVRKKKNASHGIFDYGTTKNIVPVGSRVHRVHRVQQFSFPFRSRLNGSLPNSSRSLRFMMSQPYLRLYLGHAPAMFSPHSCSLWPCCDGKMGCNPFVMYEILFAFVGLYQNLPKSSSYWPRLQWRPKMGLLCSSRGACLVLRLATV